jgi:tetratricopeptide (TPR) repeat protein
MPQALRTGPEPLAADFHKQGDGKRLAFLKIVAGLAGLPLDALVQRDAQRQVRRVTGVTLGAAVLMLIMALLLIMALRAREEAERRRVGAEGVIEAMLTDVRKEARRTGNLKLRAAINNIALGYYTTQGNWSDLPDESVERRARVLHALGEDDSTLGNYELARAKFDEAHRATARILERRPTDANSLFAHAQSEFWLGSVAFASDDQERAQVHWQAYLDLARALSRVERRTPRSLLEMGYAHGNLCEVNVRGERNVEAGLEHCRKALAFERAALALKPYDEEILRALANRLGWFSDSLMTREKFAEARAHREAEAAVVSSLLKMNPRDVELRDRAVWPQIGLAKIDIAEGKLAQGLARYRACLRDLDRLGTEFPDDQTILARRVRVNVLLGKALKAQRRSEWRNHRNIAAALLEKAGGKSESSLARTYKMLESLDNGDT